MALINKGLSDREGKEKFIVEGNGLSHFSKNDGKNEVDITSIDIVFKSKKVGYIKMDIEGEELNALRGAEIVIKRDKPNMMISVYHKADDIIEIPLLLLKYNSEYKFALGHYNADMPGDTVLYAF